MTISRLSLLAIALCACTRTPTTPPAPSTGGVPSTDVYVYRLGRSLVPFRSRLTNVTHRTGYDNQPYWDGPSLLFTSIRDGQADIYRYTHDSTVRVTTTPESEYSPSITPDGHGISVVRVERDSTQRLWRFSLEGGAPAVLLSNIKPVGYYAWLDSARVALYVLGSPDTLEIADVGSGAANVVTTDIGRSLQRVPGGSRVSFVRREDDHWVLRTASASPGPSGAFDIATVATLPDSAEYVAWRSATEIYTASGSRIYRLRLPSGTWQRVANLADDGLGRITRLAISPDGQSLAIVAEDRP
jgi:WD40 repeat protein